MPGNGDGIRRHALLIGVASYKYLDERAQLPKANEERRRASEIFVDGLGFAEILPELADGPSAGQVKDVLGDWVTTPNVTSDDALLIYWSGHGVVGSDNRLYLMCNGSRLRNLAGSALTVDELMTVVAQSPIKSALLLTDTCYSETATVDALVSASRWGAISRTRRGRHSGYWTISSAQALNEAEPHVFLDAFEGALRSRAQGGDVQEYIDILDLVEAINEELPSDRQQATVSVFGGSGTSRVLRNPNYEAAVPPGLDLVTQRRAAREQDVSLHWSPRARGVEIESQTGSFFRGRRSVLRTVCSWIGGTDAHDRRGMVITGNPGSGKSAILARLVLLSDELAPRDEADVGLMPAPGSITAAIYCRRKDLEDILGELQNATGLTAVTDTNDIIDALASARSSSQIIVLDGLDEANEPDRVIHELVMTLVNGRGARVLLGARRHLIELLEDKLEVTDIDEPHLIEVEDITSYVEALLVADRDDDSKSPYACATKEQVTGVAGHVGNAAYPSFLIARLVSRALAGREEPVPFDSNEWATALPSSVPDAMREDLERYGPDRQRIEDLLRPLALAQGEGLPWTGLWRRLASSISGTEYSDADIEYLQRVAGAYVVQALEDERAVYRLYHQALADYLVQPESAANIELAYVRILEQAVPTSQGESDWSQAQHYTLNYLPAHAARCGELHRLLKDESFVVHAAPQRLMAAIAATKTSMQDRLSTPGNAPDVSDFYEAAYASLRTVEAAERGLYLRIAALQFGSDAFAGASSEDSVWAPLWARRSMSDDRVILDIGNPVRDLVFCVIEGQPVLLVATHDGRVMAWYFAGLSTLWTAIPFDGQSVASMKLMESDPSRVICMSVSGQFALIEVHTGAIVRRWSIAMVGHSFAMTSIAWGGGDVVLGGGYDGRIYTKALGTTDWVDLTGKRAQSRWIACIGCKKSNGRIVVAVGGGDETIYLCDDRGHPLIEYPIETEIGVPNALVLIEEDENLLLAVASEDGELGLYSIATGALLDIYPSGQVSWIRTVMDASSGREILVVAGSSGSIYRFDCSGGTFRDVGSSHGGEQSRGHSEQSVAVVNWAGQTWVLYGSRSGVVHAVPQDVSGTRVSAGDEILGAFALQVSGESGDLLLMDSVGVMHSLNFSRGEPTAPTMNTQETPAFFKTYTARTGTYAAVLPTESGILHIWRVRTREPIERVHLEVEGIKSLAFTSIHGDFYLLLRRADRVASVDLSQSGEVDEFLHRDLRSRQIFIDDTKEPPELISLEDGRIVSHILPLYDLEEPRRLLQNISGIDHFVVANQRGTQFVGVASSDGVVRNFTPDGIQLGSCFQAGRGPLGLIRYITLHGELCTMTVDADGMVLRVWRLGGALIGEIHASSRIVDAVSDNDSTIVLASHEIVVAVQFVATHEVLT